MDKKYEVRLHLIRIGGINCLKITVVHETNLVEIFLLDLCV